MSINSYLVMFAIGYVVFSLIAETLNPFKPNRWLQPKHQHLLGLSSWLVLASTPVVLNVLGIRNFTVQLLAGLFYVASAGLIVALFYMIVERLNAHKPGKKQTPSLSTPGIMSRLTESLGLLNKQRNSSILWNSKDRPPVFIDADRPEVAKVVKNRITRKLATGSAQKLLTG